MTADCHDCGVPVLDATPTGPAMLGVRAVGMDGPAKKRCPSVLCPRCCWRRGEDAQQSRQGMEAR